MLRSFGFGLGLETFANFLRVSVSVSENLVSEKKSRYRFQKIWYWKKSLGIGFGKLGIGKKSRYRFRKIWYRKKSLGIGFGQIFGIVIQRAKGGIYRIPLDHQVGLMSLQMIHEAYKPVYM